MNTIGLNIEEKVKEKLGYEEKPWEIPKKLFANLVAICIISNIPVRMKGNRVDTIQLEICRGKKNYGEFPVRPVIKNDRLHLLIKQPERYFIDASLVFGEQVQDLS